MTMEEALASKIDFYNYIFDDAEDCILNHGIHLDSDTNKLFGFWKLLQRNRSFLITSTEDKGFYKALNELKFLSSDYFDYTFVFKKVYPRREEKQQNFISLKTEAAKEKMIDKICEDLGHPKIIVSNSARRMREICHDERIKSKDIPIMRI